MMRPFTATAIREWRTVRRYPDAFLGALMWPLLTPVLYLFQIEAFSGGDDSVRGAFETRAGTAQIAGFLYVGWLVGSWLNTMLTEMSASMRDQLVRGSLEGSLLSPASRVALVFGPAPVYLGLGVLTFVAILATVVLGTGLRPDTVDILKAFGLLMLAGPVLAALGALLANAVLLIRNTAGLVDTVRGLFATLCGFMYPVAVLPDWAERVAHALPPTWAADVLRDVLLRGGSAGVPGFAAAILGAAVGVGALTYATFALAERRARHTGTLGGY